MDPDGRGATLNEALEVVSRLWEGDPVTHDGEFYTLSDAAIGFEPASAPPIYVASAAFDPGSGFPTTIRRRLTAHGDGWLPIAMSPDSYAAGLERIRELLGDAGRPADAIDPAYYLDVVVAGSDDAALEEARAFYRRYYGEQVAYRSDESLSDAAIRERGAFGPPDAVETRLHGYVYAGVERFVVRFPAADQRGQLRAFEPILRTAR